MKRSSKEIREMNRYSISDTNRLEILEHEESMAWIELDKHIPLKEKVPAAEMINLIQIIRERIENENSRRSTKDKEPIKSKNNI